MCKCLKDVECRVALYFYVGTVVQFYPDKYLANVIDVSTLYYLLISTG